MSTDNLKTNRMDAARAGQSKYEGGPCGKCGGTIRYTVSANCARCQSEDTAARKRQLQAILRAAKASRGEG